VGPSLQSTLGLRYEFSTLIHDKFNRDVFMNDILRAFFLIVYTGAALGILEDTIHGTTLFGRSALQDFEGV
jgi:hypothetical protein